MAADQGGFCHPTYGKMPRLLTEQVCSAAGSTLPLSGMLVDGQAHPLQDCTVECHLHISKGLRTAQVVLALSGELKVLDLCASKQVGSTAAVRASWNGIGPVRYTGRE